MDMTGNPVGGTGGIDLGAILNSIKGMANGLYSDIYADADKNLANKMAPWTQGSSADMNAWMSQRADEAGARKAQLLQMLLPYAMQQQQQKQAQNDARLYALQQERMAQREFNRQRSLPPYMRGQGNGATITDMTGGGYGNAGAANAYYDNKWSQGEGSNLSNRSRMLQAADDRLYVANKMAGYMNNKSMYPNLYNTMNSRPQTRQVSQSSASGTIQYDPNRRYYN